MSDKPLFKPGDCIGMIGDSITCDTRWWSGVRCGFLTQLPGCNLDFRNLAIPGDSAVETLKRYDWDIAPVPLTVACLMLGMNDVWREGYADLHPTTEALAKRRAAIHLSSGSIRRLVEKLQARGIRVALFSPTPYEQEASLPDGSELLYGVDDALQECAACCRAIATDCGATFIDVHTPLLRISRALRRDDPSATIIGPDRVHPGDLGHAVLARTALQTLLPPSCLASESGCIDLELKSAGSLHWTYTGPVLNLAIPAQADVLLGLPPQRLFWRAHLTRGRWTLFIEGEPVHTAAAVDWAAGIDVGALYGPLRRHAEEIHRASNALCSEERRFRMLLMLRIWSQRGAASPQGENFLAYLNMLEAEQPPMHWLRDTATDAKLLLTGMRQHQEAVASLRAALQLAAQPWRFKCELHPA